MPEAIETKYAPALSVAKAEYLVVDWYVDDPEPLRAAVRGALLEHGLVRSSAPRGRSAPDEAEAETVEKLFFDGRHGRRGLSVGN